MTDHAELRMVAGEAIGRSESEWYVVRGLSHVRDGEDNFICDTCEDEPILASYIATATPKTVLAMLDEIDGLLAQHGRDSSELRALCQARDDARKERDRLKAENDRLRQGMKGDYDIDAWLDWLKEKERIKAENEALRGALQAVEAEVDGNLRPLTRDLVNMVSGLKNGSHPNDIYEHCDEIERIIGAAIEGAEQ
ncbi:TPA: hypothetical protein NH204_006654 [Pseudomonas aeruginosa]|nr:hypothetical protein [Pseudomonas aeruginosa]